MSWCSSLRWKNPPIIAVLTRTNSTACWSAYVASEAITNVAKHAQASVITMRVDGRDGALILSISDDGIGGADPSRGSGIIGLKDRVEALGGTISVVSPPGHGTTLHVQLPADPMAVPTLPGDTPEPPPAGRDG
jgi:signal transduction histidine kinase